MKKYLLLLCILTSIICKAADTLRRADKIRIHEATLIVDHVKDQIWQDISKTPFVILFVTDSNEFLLNHPYPSSDFTSSGYDSLLHTTVYSRPKKFQSWLLATFPAVNGVPCIVVGTPENTNRSSSDWVITLVHEHFHQLQFTRPGYYDGVNALDLSNGDQTGMWQINYPFPYDSLPIINQFNLYASALSKAIDSRKTKHFKPAFASFIKGRKKLMQLLKSSDARYLSFQLWQEGIARYTEYKYLQALDNYLPSAEMQSLADFIPFNTLQEQLYSSETGQLRDAKLSANKRVSFYSIGFAEGLLLDEVNPKWRSKYFNNPFTLDNLLH